MECLKGNFCCFLLLLLTLLNCRELKYGDSLFCFTLPYWLMFYMHALDKIKPSNDRSFASVATRCCFVYFKC